jgi:two-component system chemotaxis response regulator CheB
MKSGAKIRVLIIDDSALVRRLIEDSLRGEDDIEVVGQAPDPYVAREKILALSPHVVTLDIEMPRMDGLSFLKRLMHYRPLPAIIISSLGQAGSQMALEALRWGAVEVLAKPSGPNSLSFSHGVLAAKVRAAAQAKLTVPGTPPAAPARWSGAGYRRKALLIGSSTGGPPAIETVLREFGAECPPILIAQHIPAGFSRSFAERLDREMAMEVREAQNGDELRPGRVLIAPGNFHMLVSAAGGGYRVAVKDGPLVRYQRPSVDVLFRSAARALGRDCVAAILTGMGSDGAEGLLAIRQQGGWTIAQDEASSTVYGMPRAAVRLGAAAEVVSLRQMAERLDGAMRRTAREEVSLLAEV